MSDTFDHEVDAFDDLTSGRTFEGDCEPVREYRSPRSIPSWKNFAQPKEKKMEKKLDVVCWTTGDGELLAFDSMKDSHLLNSIAYINRRMDEHARVKQQAADRGFRVPAFTINGELGSFWIDKMLEELNNRAEKKIAAAKKVLEQEAV